MKEVVIKLNTMEMENLLLLVGQILLFMLIYENVGISKMFIETNFFCYTIKIVYNCYISYTIQILYKSSGHTVGKLPPQCDLRFSTMRLHWSSRVFIHVQTQGVWYLVPSLYPTPTDGRTRAFSRPWHYHLIKLTGLAKCYKTMNSTKLLI